VSKLGTVKTIAGNTLTIATDAGQSVTVNVVDGAKIVKLAVGSTDLKTATPSQLSDIAVGDRVLTTGKAGDAAGSLNAQRVILMKSSDIAQMQAAQQADWKARGVGGIVNATDPATGVITLTVGTKKLAVNTSGKTQFKRFSGDSVKYENAKPGKLADIQVKDQLQARGAKSADGLSIEAEEVVSGSFLNLSGVLLSVGPTEGVDASTGTITLKDLATKKIYTVTVTANSDQRKMPLQMATMFAARTSGGGSGSGQAGGQSAGRGSGGSAGTGGATGQGEAGGRRSAGGDLSQMIGRLPTSTLAGLKNGDAVMIVASEPSPGATTVTAITLLSGVEPILTANPKGGMDLSGWSMSSGPGGSGE
jgi:co-chaperonin GroES (HSP10)